MYVKLVCLKKLYIDLHPGLAGQCLPENVGFRIGQNGVKTVLLEIHWNNPMLVDSYTDGSGIRLFYEPFR